MARWLALLAVVALWSVPCSAAEPDGWIEMFDGKSFDGWEINENSDGFKIVDGAIVINGPRGHAFYKTDKPFKNFEFQAEVMTKENSNSGIFFHTKFQPDNWPKYGIEAQVNNTYTRDPIKTGSLYQVVNVRESAAKDNEWFPYVIKVEGQNVQITVNGKMVVEYNQPLNPTPGEPYTRVLGEGTFALQAHDPGSTVSFRNLKVRRIEK